MTWTLGHVIVHPDDQQHAGSVESNWAIQTVIGGTVNVKNHYGSNSPRQSLSFILDEDLNGNGGKDAIEGFVTSGSTVALSGDYGALGSFNCLNFQWSRRQALNHTNPVYQCSVSLIEA